MGFLMWRARSRHGEAFMRKRDFAIALLYSSLLGAIFIYAFVGGVLVALRRILLGGK